MVFPASVVGVLDWFNIHPDWFSKVNRPPEVHGAIILSPESISIGNHATVTVIATDPDGDELQYFWSAHSGRIEPDIFQGPSVKYIPPDKPGLDMIKLRVYDGVNGTVDKWADITVKPRD